MKLLDWFVTKFPLFNVAEQVHKRHQNVNLVRWGQATHDHVRLRTRRLLSLRWEQSRRPWTGVRNYFMDKMCRISPNSATLLINFQPFSTVLLPPSPQALFQLAEGDLRPRGQAQRVRRLQTARGRAKPRLLHSRDWEATTVIYYHHMLNCQPSYELT